MLKLLCVQGELSCRRCQCRWVLRAGATPSSGPGHPGRKRDSLRHCFRANIASDACCCGQIRSCMQLAVCYGPELPLGDDSEQDRGLHTLAPALHVIHGPKRILMEHDWTVASATTGCLVSHDSWRAGGACA
ncbi:hypothetical protein C6341_g8611 [Phytophthora cactorum]|nr:hypothetical protein C6341_g8611 [Phytophthora cactorum]KAG4049997.1 hypothetical protein PC123_g14744 [Phytophthora cactorum]